jgi:hypothetical protein
MQSESNETSARLSQAVAHLKESGIADEVLSRGEARILARHALRRPLFPRIVLLATGLGVAAFCGALLLLPTRSVAAEVGRIGRNADTVFHRVRSYQVKPDGSLALSDEYVVGFGKVRLNVPDGEVILFEKRVTIVHPDGSATVETQRNQNYPAPSATALIKANTAGHVADMSIDRGIAWRGLNVDRYTVDEDVLDGRKQPMHVHFVLYADPKNERPLEMDSKDTGFPDMVSKWDYPAPDPKLLELPANRKIRLYDLDAERANIITALGMPGQKVVVAGQTVELLQLWAGEGGDSVAIARSDYDWPENYGIQIDGMKLSTLEGADQPSHQYFVHHPTLGAGKFTQLFWAARYPNSGPMPYPDRVNVSLPVFKGTEFVGYAKFQNVPVHRAWSTYFLLRPKNVPFWLPEPSTPAIATLARPE